MNRVFTVSDAIVEAFPELRIHLVAVRALRNDSAWPRVDAGLVELEADAAAGRWTAPLPNDPRIASWHAAYRAFGTNPKRSRPSVEALSRRLARSSRLPRINPAVDAYNLLSARHSVPAGAFDLSGLGQQVDIRHAVAGDVFTPLGEPDTRESARPGEVVYVHNEHEVLTRHWNHRDADATKVTADSKAVVFVFESVSMETAVWADAAAKRLSLMLEDHGVVAGTQLLSAEARTAEIPA